MELIKEEDVKILNNNRFSDNDKVVEMECIIVYGLDSEELLLDCK